MIYTFIKGVSPERFAQIKTSVDQTIELRPVSHRDPSGAIPALAEAVRCRRFDHAAVISALDSGRLTVIRTQDNPALLKILKDQIARYPSKEIGIFAHSNAAVALLADQLNEANIDHVLVGIPEAHAEALSAMAIQCSFAIGLAVARDLRSALAIFLTAAVHGRKVPDLAYAFLGKKSLHPEIEANLSQVETALSAASTGSIGDLALLAMNSYPSLHIPTGSKSWHRAASHFRRIVQPYRNEDVSLVNIELLNKTIERNRVEALIDLDYSEHGRVRLMNYHQTKGREADMVIHVFHDNDYFGPESEPFEELSRLLNVALSRARERVIVLLPPNPHPLVEPFGALIRDAKSHLPKI